jgi:hypothetical protein
MSERSDIVPTPEGEFVEATRFAPLSFLLALLGLVGLGLSVVGAFVSPHQFSFSWLFAFALFFTMLAGCFSDHRPSRRRRGMSVGPPAVENWRCFSPMALFFIPIVIFRHHLYEWMNIPVGRSPPDSKRGYLNWNFFLRAVFYFVFFIGGLSFSGASSRRTGRNPAFTPRMRRLGSWLCPV